MTILWAKLIQWQFCKYLKTSFSTARPVSSSGTVARHGRHPSSSAHSDFSFPSTVSRKKNSGMKRSSPRSLLSAWLGPRDDEDGSRRAEMELAFGKMQSFALRRLGFLGRASNGKEIRCDTWKLYRASVRAKRQGNPGSTGSIR